MKALVRRWLVLVGMALAIGLTHCSSAPSGDENVGQATAEVSSIPSGVLCIQVTVVGSQTVSSLFTVSSTSSTNLQLAGLPLGSDTFVGAAFSVACASSATATPTYVTSPVIATITASAPFHVNLAFVANGHGSVGVSFPDAGPGVLPNTVSCDSTGCVCVAGYGNCNGALTDGCEANLNTDPANCGGCGNSCNGGACVNGSCGMSACGMCAAGFTCGSAGFCVSAQGVPALAHVFLIAMNGTSLSDITGSASAPYINGLMSQYAVARNYTTSLAPDLPNYLDLVSGSSQGVMLNGSPTQFGNLNAAHLGDSLDAAQVTWREYAESAGLPCNMTDNGVYATKDVPFLYFKDITSVPATCTDRVVDYSTFASDLMAPRRFSMISPNLCDNMSTVLTGCPSGTDRIKNGDTWLQTNAAKIVSALGPSDALFIVWDEATGGMPGPMPLIVVSPLAKAGSTTAAYNHESLLATIAQGLLGAVPSGLGSAPMANPINDVWK
jgi:acid phosphatase